MTEPPVPTSNRFYSQRLKLHYVEWGRPDAPLLLLLHGGRDHCRSWDWTARALADRWRIIAPDLRGHGDSDWSPEGDYAFTAFVYDLAQLVHILGDAPVSIAAHSLGGNIAIRYAGLFPDKVRRLVSIEGLGLSPTLQAERDKVSHAERIRTWIAEKRAAGARTIKRYASIDDALERMKEENKFLSDAQARHLTQHGLVRNEDATWSWKFDQHLRVWHPVDIPQADVHALWAAIACPTLLIYGADSWASNPEKDGRAAHFRNARVSLYERAGHWVHHDRFDDFLKEIESFLGAPQ